MILRCYELVTRKARKNTTPKEVDFRNQRVKKALYTEFEPNRDTPQYVILRCYELVTRKRGKIPPQRGAYFKKALYTEFEPNRNQRTSHEEQYHPKEDFRNPCVYRV